jgi:hypothetical protein
MDEQSHSTSHTIAAWGVSLTAIHCPQCKEAHLVPEDDVPPRCPFCLQGPVEPQPALLPEEPPEQTVPYGISKSRLDGILERWAQGIWFRPSDLQAQVLSRRARPYLVPLWLVDGQVEAEWKADVGFDYQVVSSQERYRDGAGWSSQQVEETRVRWEPRVGRLRRGYENLAAPALDDHRQVMARLGEYDLRQRESYDPDVTAQAAIRVPTLEPEAAWPGAETALVQAAQTECQQAAGADHIRDFAIDARYSGLNWTLLLLPAYVTWYKEGDQVWPLLINGQNGRVSGARRASASKARTASIIAGAVALLLILLGGLMALGGLVFPPLLAVGGVVLLIGVIPAIIAPIPMISVWAFNRRTDQGQRPHLASAR